jgi:hypothetical protein
MLVCRLVSIYPSIPSRLICRERKSRFWFEDRAGVAEVHTAPVGLVRICNLSQTR